MVCPDWSSHALWQGYLPVRFLGSDRSPQNQRELGWKRHHSSFQALIPERSRVGTCTVSPAPRANSSLRLTASPPLQCPFQVSIRLTCSGLPFPELFKCPMKIFFPSLIIHHATNGEQCLSNRPGRPHRMAERINWKEDPVSCYSFTSLGLVSSSGNWDWMR